MAQNTGKGCSATNSSHPLDLELSFYGFISRAFQSNKHDTLTDRAAKGLLSRNGDYLLRRGKCCTLLLVIFFAGSTQNIVVHEKSEKFLLDERRVFASIWVGTNYVKVFFRSKF